MGAVCVANKKNNLPIKEELTTIKCKVIYQNKQVQNYFFKSTCVIKEMKAEIARKLKKDKKSIMLEIQGKSIKYELLQLGYIVKEKLDEVEITVQDLNPQKNAQTDVNIQTIGNVPDLKQFNSNLSKSQDMEGGSVMLDENSIYFLSKPCEIHNSERLTMICQVCGVSICQLCVDQCHKDHQLIKKIQIVEFNHHLRETYSHLQDRLSEMNLKCSYVEYIKNFRMDMKKYTDEFMKAAELLKKKETEIVESFKNKIDNCMPSVLCYRDNLESINKEYDQALNFIVSDDRAFMRYYQEYLILSSQASKNANNVSTLQIRLKNFESVSEEYKTKAEKMIQFTTEQIEYLNGINFNQNDSEYEMNYNDIVRKAHSDNNTENASVINTPIVIDKNKSSMNVGDNLSILQKMANAQSKSSFNLKLIMSTPNKNLSEMIRKKKFHKSSNANADDSPFEAKSADLNKFSTSVIEVVPKNIYTIEIGSNSIFVFDTEGSEVRKEIVEMPLGVTKFESFHASLNYNCKLYVSGNGFNSSKNFMILEVGEGKNEMKKLPDMKSNHSFHGMLGFYGHILVISGFKTNKVELFNSFTQAWISLPNLNKSRTWPCSIFLENLGIFVFGGAIEGGKNKEENVAMLKTMNIEKLDISKVKSLINMFSSNSNDQPNFDQICWEVISINLNENLQTPIYFGFIPLASESAVLVVGGKRSLDSDESESAAYKLKFDTLEFTLDKSSLKVPDEFDGKLFLKYNKNSDNKSDNISNNEVKVEEKAEYYAQFSANVSKRVHIYNCSTEAFSYLESKLQSSSLLNISKS